ncbi:Guanine/hypoxanthine permease PbuG [Halomicronema hongdechloris C2206]|uniref:Guanine/hypoxanthine permease PbuG n=1 Tax=Halomicronema hongdechloris C2206 TaxID=1641165 RepID=A0A1Z3HKY2_9CYAN|nr:NCS2 family permease [Halomicronema hongdechloris]ASC70958.1 Guanine/hypoxanthine permease PbuG [Halomicronema hongdechloris C2206]
MTNDINAPLTPENDGAIARFFNFAALNTNLRTELLAGVTTFFTMAYILVVNPDILSNAIFLNDPRDLFGELVMATGLAAALATLIMGLYAKLPFALAPGMGINAYFAFTVVLGLGVDWRVALAAVFVEGIIFILLTLSNLRSAIVAAIPEPIKHATTAGIGLFIAYIALKGAGIIVASETTLTTLGNLRQPATATAILGIVITAALVTRRVAGSLLWGIIATALLAWVFGVAPWPGGVGAIPTPPVDLFGQAFVGLGQLLRNNIWQLVSIVFVFLFVDLFDTIGTLTGLGTKAGYIDAEGKFPQVEKAFMADAVGTTAGSVLGTSTVTTYIESASGIAVGGRSGLTAVVAAVLFAASILLIPFFSGIPSFATAPALLIVGVLMMSGARHIDWDDPAAAIASFLTILMMPLSYSIAEGLAMGLIAYPLLKLVQGKGRDTSLGMWILAIIFILRYLFGGL